MDDKLNKTSKDENTMTDKQMEQVAGGAPWVQDGGCRCGVDPVEKDGRRVCPKCGHVYSQFIQ